MDQPQNSVHLTKDDIDKLIGSPRMEETAAEALHLHLSTCESCHSLMMRHLAAKDALEMARAKEPGKRTPDCAGIDVWRSVAAGSLTPERSMPLLEHAANCDRCGALLAEAGDEAVIGPSEEDQRIMEQMASATVEGRRKLAQR